MLPSEINMVSKGDNLSGGFTADVAEMHSIVLDEDMIDVDSHCESMSCREESKLDYQLLGESDSEDDVWFVLQFAKVNN